MQSALISDVFINNLLPVLLCAGTGFLIGKTQRLDIRSASSLAFHIFCPCLVFTSLERITITGAEFAKLAALTVSVSILIGLLAWLAGLSMRAERHLIAAMVVASMCVNNGNYGLATTQFSFGEEALARSLVCFVFATVIIYTLGVFVSSMGKLSIRQALGNLLKVPTIYALIIAALVRQLNWQVPLFLDRSISLLGNASIPLMLVILGMQIAATKSLPRNRMALISASAFLQLAISPILALLISHGLHLTGPARQAAVLQASMPAAVVTTVLATQYDLDKPLVSGVVVLTTILSPLTLTPLIAYLM